jgi:hypothetical protein
LVQEAGLKLTVILPSIRPEKWQEVYNSIENAVKGRYDWEFLAIGPYPGTIEAKTGKFAFIGDHGSPCHCMQRGVLLAKGEFITWIADDALFMENVLNREFNADAIFCKYVEGRPDPNDKRWEDPELAKIVPYCRGDVALNPDMVLDKSWKIDAHVKTKSRFIPGHWCILSLGIIKRDVLLEIGGWDTYLFEVTGMASPDLGIRLQRKCVNCILWPEIVQTLEYKTDNNRAGSKVVEAHVSNDEPNYARIYDDESCLTRTNIPINPSDYWPSVWKR